MNYAAFRDDAWSAMPPIRKRVVGRQVFDELFDTAVQEFAGDYLSACRDDRQRRQYARELLEQVRARHQAVTGMGQQEYGFIWVFLLCAVASAVIQWLIKRWLDNHFTNETLHQWKQEMPS